MTIDAFDGPLDLMLHLIREKELDLFNLDVNVLCDQYTAYLASMEEMHLEVASEYLVEMAVLIEYKSRKLLPDAPDDLNTDAEDPREKLVRRLLEYQQYKEVSEELSQMFAERQMLMTKPLSAEAEQWMKVQEPARFEGNPYDLLKAMKRIMLRQQLARPVQTRYAGKEISMEERSLQIRARLSSMPKNFRFETLLEDCDSRPMMIATFLAVLDLARQHVLYFTQDEDGIWFSRGGYE